jgi:hypothetical protein
MITVNPIFPSGDSSQSQFETCPYHLGEHVKFEEDSRVFIVARIQHQIYEKKVTNWIQYRMVNVFLNNTGLL